MREREDSSERERVRERVRAFSCFLSHRIKVLTADTQDSPHAP